MTLTNARHTNPRDYSAEMHRQRCKVCWNADGFNFYVPDRLWRSVVPDALQDHVVCLMCFDRFAAELGIDYTDHLGPIYFAGDQVALELRVTNGDDFAPSRDKPDKS